MDLTMQVSLKGSNQSDFVSNELIHIKVMIKGDDQDPQAVRLELTSEEDIFFHYVCE